MRCWTQWASGTSLPRTSEVRRAWERLVPLLDVLPLSGWTAEERRRLVALAGAKAGRSERDFVRAWLAHPRLDDAFLRAFGRRG
jgi:hypothetical protein